MKKLFRLLRRFITFLTQAMDKKRKNASWLNVASLLAGLAAFEVYRTLSLADAAYQGKEYLYYFSYIAPGIILAVILWEIVCIIGLERWRRALLRVTSIWNKIGESRFLKIFLLTIAADIIVLGGIGGYAYINRCETKYYDAVVEIYGIPNGVGESLERGELENRAGYWQIDDYPGRHCMTLTYVDAYGQLELMRQYSSAYDMALFQIPSRIEYHYKKSERKFHDCGQEIYDLAKENGFREPVKISYYNSNGKLLLELSGEGYEKQKVDIYISEDQPQLLNSTLLRFPKGEMVENGSVHWQIESSCYPDGRLMQRRFGSELCNLYGINGERYTYDQDQRLNSICYLDANGDPMCNKQGIMLVMLAYDENDRCIITYYSDEDGIERTEGFYGVYCEELTFDSNGNLKERQQKDRQGRWCSDINGVHRYIYEYTQNALQLEYYLGTDEELVRNNQFDSQSTYFVLEKEKGTEKTIEVYLDYYDAAQMPPDAGRAKFLPTDGSTAVLPVSVGQVFYPERNSWAAAGEEAVSGQSDTQWADDGDKIDGRYKNQEADRTSGCKYSVIQNIITDHALTVKYRTGEGDAVINELGYAEKRLRYDNRMRVVEEIYLDKDGVPCVINSGYASVRKIYGSGQNDEIKRIAYLDVDGNLTTNREKGYAYVTFDYMQVGQNRQITSSYFDAQDASVYLPGLGYASVEDLYDKNGFLIQETYRDAKGRITYRNDYGVAAILYEYADDGNVIREWYKDARGKQINRSDTGYAVIYQQFEAGQLSRRYYEGYRGRILCAVPDRTTGIYDVVYSYDRGNKIQEEYFDDNGRPVLRTDIGCAKIRYEYDGNGDLLAEYYYGTDGKPILIKDGWYASVRYESDIEGKSKTVRYYGTEEQPVINTQINSAGYQEIYEGDQQRKILYLGLDGELQNRIDYGYAQEVESWDEARKMRKRSYLGTDGVPVMLKEYGYAFYENYYDENKNCIESRYYDTYERLVQRKDAGYAVVKYEYDKNGYLSSTRYYDENEQPTISSENHCAGILTERDSYGNAVNIQYIDIDGALLSRDDYGFAKVCRAFDVRTGKVVWESYFDTNEQLTLRKEYGYASVKMIYDEYGNNIENRYYDTGEELVLRADTGYAFSRIQYNEYGKPASWLYYDENGQPVISTKYHCAGMMYTYDKSGNLSVLKYLDMYGNLINRSDYGLAQIYKYYDELGYLTGEAYFDVAGQPAVRKDRGYASYNEVYVRGNLTECRFYDIQKNLVPRMDVGYALLKQEYDEYGRIRLAAFYGVNEESVISSKYNCAKIETNYMDGENLTEITYLGFDNKPMIREDFGCAKVRQTYDTLGNLVQEAYFDVQEQPVLRKDYGYASYKKTFRDGDGRWIETGYFDTSGNPILCKDTGYAFIRCEYDRYGREALYTYYDTEEQPVISTSYNCAGMSYSYDKKGYLSKILYLDTAGNSMSRRDFGCAQIIREYNRFGQIATESYWDECGQPAIRRKYGYASCEYNYGDNGKLLESRYYDADHHLVARKDTGYALEVCSYDVYGQLEARYYYGTDPDPKPVMHKQDQCSGIEYTYEKGNETIRYLGLDHLPMTQKKYGCAQIRKEYDDSGYLIKESYYDMEGNLVERKDLGYAFCEISYDKYGRRTETRYYDAAGKPVLTKDEKIAAESRRYDGYGRIAQYTYYGTENEPRENAKYLCAGLKYVYDEMGSQTEIQYQGTDGKTEQLRGLEYAQIHEAYNDKWQLVKSTYIDRDGQTVTQNGYTSEKNFYDDRGNLTEVWYLDQEDKLIPRKDTEYAVIKYEYNELGQCVSEAYYDDTFDPNNPDVSRTVNKENGCAMLQYRYDERGNRTYVWYCGKEGTSSIHPDYGVMLEFRVYDAYDRLTEEAYYIQKDSKFLRAVHKELGYAYATYEYDEQGNCIGERYLDENDKPVIYEKVNYAVRENTYNDIGQIICVQYYGKEGKLIESVYDCAKEEYIYNEAGNVIEWSCYGASGNEKKKTGYYESGEIEKIVYYDESGNAEKKVEYYEPGNVREIVYYDESGNAEKKVEYYESGNVREIVYYDEAGNVKEEFHYDDE